MKKSHKISKELKKNHLVHVLEISGKGFLVNKNSVHSCASRYNHKTFT